MAKYKNIIKTIELLLERGSTAIDKITITSSGYVEPFVNDVWSAFITFHHAGAPFDLMNKLEKEGKLAVKWTGDHTGLSIY